MDDLEQRIAKLEAESDIRKLKARYLNACDAKDMAAIRACFSDDAEIVFPPLGSFDLDELMDIFEQMAASAPIVDVHQGHNGEIDINGDMATGIWNLGFATYDPRAESFRLLASFYHDKYRKTDSGWRICYTRSEPRAIVDGTLEKDGLIAKWVKE